MDVQLITINVGNINRAPVFDPIGTQEVNVGETLQFTVNANDPDGDAIVLALANVPVGASFDPATGVFTWIPTVDQSGGMTLNFSATDNGAPSQVGELEVTVTVGDDLTVAERIRNLSKDVKDLNLPKKTEKKLRKKLRKALKHLHRGKVRQAVKKLYRFIQKVEQAESKGDINPQDADALIDEANAIIALLRRC